MGDGAGVVGRNTQYPDKQAVGGGTKEEKQGLRLDAPFLRGWASQSTHTHAGLSLVKLAACHYKSGNTLDDLLH